MEENEGLLKRILKFFLRQEKVDSQQEGIDDLLAMSEHWNGYKREHAVRRLGILGNPAAIPKLLVSVNDWVPQVRSAARESLLKSLKNENAQAFIDNLPALYHLENCARSDHSNMIASVIDFLLKKENVAHITAAIENNDSHIARIAVKLCIQNSLIEKQSLVSECLSHRDVVVRKIASNLLKDLSGDALELSLNKAIHDPFMPIRREAFEIYLRVLPEKSVEIAHRFLFDKHSLIREIAVSQLLKNNIDVEPIFINVLSSTGQSALKVKGAILGLAHLHSTQSIPVVEKYASNSLPCVRKASLQAMIKLVGEDARQYLLDGLKDKSANVAKESSNLLSKLKLRPSANELLAVVNDSNYPHTLNICLSNARMIDKWERVIFILSLCRRLMLEGHSCLDILGGELGKWVVSFDLPSWQPTSAQKEQILLQYPQCRLLFSEKYRRWFESVLRGFGIEM